jgi:hypothetical protein
MAGPANDSDERATSSAAWEERVAAGEPEQFAEFIRQVHQYQDGFARSGDGEAHRAFHVKTHAAVRADFTVRPDIPEFAKHGIFAEPKTFPALVRISNGFSAARMDWFPDLLGFTVKLTGVEGPKLLEGEGDADTQDFLTLNQPYLPAYDPKQLVIISLAAANLLSAPVKIVGALGIPHGMQVLLWTLGWSLGRFGIRSVATEDYSSEVPITIGPHAIKFAWRPRRTSAPASRGNIWQRNFLRDEFKHRLLDGDVVFDFRAQFYVDDERTPIDGAFPWKESVSPFVTLAELTIRRRDLDTAEARIEEKYIDGLSFNPWHAIEAHRPIGNIQRARRVVYRAGALHRGRADDPTVP